MPKEKLTPIPRPRKGRPLAGGKTAAGAAAAPVDPSAPPDLAHIALGLRSLAVPCADLAFDPANARTHGEENLAAIRASLRVYGQRRPVVANRRTGHVEAGNGMLQAALSLGWTHVACLWVDDDPTAAAGFALADNRAAELAGWDARALDALLRTVQTDDEELAAMLTRLAEQEGVVPAGEEAEGDEGAVVPLDVTPPPALTWVLFCIPTVRFGEVSADVERLAAISGIVLEMSSKGEAAASASPGDEKEEEAAGEDGQP